MNEKLKTITNSLIPETSSIKDIATAKMFSELCEDTCSNLFAFSPYQLQIEKDTFLRFQYLADELKNYITSLFGYVDFIPRKLRSNDELAFITPDIIETGIDKSLALLAEKATVKKKIRLL